MCSERERLEQEQQITERELNEALRLTSGPQPASPPLQQRAKDAMRRNTEAIERLTKHRAEHGC